MRFRIQSLSKLHHFLFACQSFVCRCASIVLLTGLAVFSAAACGFLMGEEFVFFGGGVILAVAAIVKTL